MTLKGFCWKLLSTYVHHKQRNYCERFHFCILSKTFMVNRDNLTKSFFAFKFFLQKMKPRTWKRKCFLSGEIFKLKSAIGVDKSTCLQDKENKGRINKKITWQHWSRKNLFFIKTDALCLSTQNRAPHWKTLTNLLLLYKCFIWSKINSLAVKYRHNILPLVTYYFPYSLCNFTWIFYRSLKVPTG